MDSASSAGVSPDSLHAKAVTAEQSLEQLATSLGQAGLDPQVVDSITKMAGIVRKLVLVLGHGQEQQPTQPGAQPAAPAAAPQQPHTMDSATAALHQSAQAAAQQRAQGQ